LEWIHPEPDRKLLKTKGREWGSDTGTATGIDGSQVG
jgi:hypothetical protein